MTSRAEEFRRYGHLAVDFIADYLAKLDDLSICVSPSHTYDVHKFISSMGALPHTPVPIDTLLQQVNDEILPGLLHWQSPNFFGWYPSSTSPASMAADIVSSGLNVIGFTTSSSPAATHLEIVCMDWLCEALSLPPSFLHTNSGGGCIQTTASESLLTVLLAARLKQLTRTHTHTHTHTITQTQMIGDTSKFVAYSSDQAHSSFVKNCRCANIQYRLIPTDRSTAYAMSVDVLIGTIHSDIKDGLIPIFVQCTVGTTSTCAIDPVEAVGRAIRDQFGDLDIWLHVDAAYAGSFGILEECNKEIVDGVELYDSFVFNPHKALMIGFDCCAMWLKEKRHLIRAFTSSAAYFGDKDTQDPSEIDFKDWQIGLGRRFRALKIYFVLKLMGLDTIKAKLRNVLNLSKRFANHISTDSRFNVCVPPRYGLTCFNLKGYDQTFQKQLHHALCANNDIFCINTVVEDDYLIRISVPFEATQQHIDNLFCMINKEATNLIDKKYDKV